MEIINMLALSAEEKEACARILAQSLPNGWPTVEDARETVAALDKPENTVLAVLEAGEVIAWGGLEPDYRGHVLELHPLVVREDRRGQGVGRTLLSALENVARARYVNVILLGCDDETRTTSLAEGDLYDDLPGKLRDFESNGHASGFYRRMGYTVVGVVPEANGRGKPDILMSKRL